MYFGEEPINKDKGDLKSQPSASLERNISQSFGKVLAKAPHADSSLQAIEMERLLLYEYSYY